MNYCSIIWSKKEYLSFINNLKKQSDLKYKDFHSKLILDNCLIGIKTPVLRKIAKEISQGNYKAFIKYNNHKYYEEKMIHGLIIGYSKNSFDDKIKLLNEFLPFIDNWAICDITCSNLKDFKKNQDQGFKIIVNYLNDNNLWVKRVGIVLLLDYYINDNYIDKILTITEKIKSEEYYVRMANAWLISMCYIKYKNKTLKLFQSNSLDKFTQNKAISKIRDSYQVNEIDKKELLKLKKI